ncbi:MAG: hypothetical protein ACK52I_22195 [Pseudomonadota bacterium]|jgi:hypothetical protein
MKKFAKTIEETLVTFHIGRGGRFYNQGHKSYIDQDKTISSYTGDLFISFENQQAISLKIGDRENLIKLFEKAIDDDEIAFEKIERITGLKFGEKVYIDCNGSGVGLNVDNDGTGIIDIDGDYNTTIVKKLEQCTDEELLIIYKSSNYKSNDVTEFCKNALLKANMIIE